MLIKNEKSSVFHTNGRMLMPGVNKVSPSWWAEARKHKTVKKRLEMGLLTEETPYEDVEDFGDDMADDIAADHISTLNVSQARQLIKDTVDVELLKAWKEKDERKTVSDEIDRQIAKVEADPEYREKGKSALTTTGKGAEVVNLDAKPSSQDD